MHRQGKGKEGDGRRQQGCVKPWRHTNTYAGTKHATDLRKMIGIFLSASKSSVSIHDMYTRGSTPCFGIAVSWCKRQRQRKEREMKGNEGNDGTREVALLAEAPIHWGPLQSNKTKHQHQKQKQKHAVVPRLMNTIELSAERSRTISPEAKSVTTSEAEQKRSKRVISTDSPQEQNAHE